MLNYNLNINSPLQQAKKNEDVRPDIYWDFHSFASASNSADLPELGFATMSINAPNTNCIQVSSDSGNLFQTDAQASVTASITGSRWPITGSTTMSLGTSGITYDPLAVNQFYSASVSASAAQIAISPSVTGSILTNQFLASEFYRFYVSGSVIHIKGNVYSPLVNWKAQNQSPVTTTGNINGHTASFNIVKDENQLLVSLPQLTGSISSSFDYAYNLGVTASLTASINNSTGSTSMSILIPEAGVNVSQQWFNETTTEAKLTGSFLATNNNPYNITASVIFNKGNIWNSDINLLITGSNPDSYSLYTIPAQYNLVKDANVNISDIDVTSSYSIGLSNEYAFNQTSSLTGSGQYSGYQVFTNVTESLQLSNSGSTTLVTASGVQQTLTQRFAVGNIEDYNIQANSFINKIPSLAVSITVIGGGGGGAKNIGGGGGAGGYVQSELLMVPNTSYNITEMGVGGNGASASIAAQTGSRTTTTIYLPVNLVGYPNQIVQALMGADGGYSGSNGSLITTNAGAGGKSGASSYAFALGYYAINNEQNGGTAFNTIAGGGGGILTAGGTGIAGLNLGGGGGACDGGVLITGSIAPTWYFQSQSFTFTGSGGNGGINSSINGQNATALGGGGGGGWGGFNSVESTGGKGGDGAIILIHSGSQKLTVPAGTITTFENGFTKYIIKTTGSFSYDYVPVPNPSEQPYEWRAELLAVGGGGRGGIDIAGGGGAGGYVYAPYTWFDTTKTYTITVGAGQNSGSLANSGSNSSVVDNAGVAIVVANGGGSGGRGGGKPGGSGGGGASFDQPGGNALLGTINSAYYTTSSYIQGFAGGRGAIDPYRNGGGGGGAATTGSNGYQPLGSGPGPDSGAGGQGRYSLDFTPIPICGGGQGSQAGGSNPGRAFGGGFGVPSSSFGQINGVANTGGGGAGIDSGNVNEQGSGGSGIVQIKYVGTPRGTGGQIQTQLASGSYYTLHTFTASGTFTPMI